MPWSHCDRSIMDDGPCPACGLSKAEWTVHVDRTRTFKLAVGTARRKKRDAWLEVRLLDPAGRPVAGAPLLVRLPDGRVHEGQLDAQGRARLEELPAGACEVDFPGLLEAPAERPTGEVHTFTLVRAPFLFSY